MRDPLLKVSFLLALIAFLFGTLLFPSIRFFAFAPFLALYLQRKELYQSLWAGALVGLLIDLFSSNVRFGIFCLCGLFTAMIAHRLKKWFYQESLLSAALYTILISFLFSLTQSLFLSQYAHASSFLMPLVDGLYGFLWFTCPLQLFSWITHRRKKFT